MAETFEQQILKVFGTTDIKKLRRISDDAAKYRKAATSIKSPAGRKNSFTDAQRAQILALQTSGTDIAKIARIYNVSRQTIYNQIHQAHHFSNDPDVQMRMNFMNRDQLCTARILRFQAASAFVQLRPDP